MSASLSCWLRAQRLGGVGRRTDARCLPGVRWDGSVRVTLDTSYRQMLLAPAYEHPVVPVDATSLGAVGPAGAR